MIKSADVLTCLYLLLFRSISISNYIHTVLVHTEVKTEQLNFAILCEFLNTSTFSSFFLGTSQYELGIKVYILKGYSAFFLTNFFLTVKQLSIHRIF